MRTRASRSFRSIIILFANASATHPCAWVIKFPCEIRLYSVRARASGDDILGRRIRWLFCRFFNRPRFVVHRPISNMPIVHTSSFAPGNYASCDPRRDKEQYSSTWARYRRTATPDSYRSRDSFQPTIQHRWSELPAEALVFHN